MEGDCPALADAVRESLVITGVPRIYRGATLGECRPEAVKGLEEIWQSGGGLFLVGEPGTGKSCALACLAAGQAERFIQAYRELPKGRVWADGGAISAALRSWERRDFLRLADAATLYVDDFGAHASSEYLVTRWDELINHRYGEELPTHFTSNTKPKELGAQWARTVSRLQEMCRFVWVGGEDRRRQR